MQGEVLVSMHSVKFEATNLLLVGARTTYQATGGADYHR